MVSNMDRDVTGEIREPVTRRISQVCENPCVGCSLRYADENQLLKVMAIKIWVCCFAKDSDTPVSS